jgi:hypothetical protein
MLITCVSGGYSIIVLAALVFDEDELTEGDEVRDNFFISGRSGASS